MEKFIKTVAFDLGGVLAYQDHSALTEEELFLFKVYMHRNSNNAEKELVEYAKSKIGEIFVKMHKLNINTIQTLEMLKDANIKPSIWTNNIPEINLWFESINLYRYIKEEDVVNSFFLGADKPDLEFYRRALLQIKNNPQDVLFFDDNINNVIAAREVNIIGEEYNMQDNLLERVDTEIKKVRRICK